MYRIQRQRSEDRARETGGMREESGERDRRHGLGDRAQETGGAEKQC
jgi:hypothetical protein